ncbi:hypothetical protein [Mucilaginibacter frigoritolerans]|nr:hypothetical protein [Mucilaginibacter frigoritolerans]
MKKQILSFAVIVAMICTITSSCSSQKNASSSDTTSKDTSKMSAPASTVDTIKKDTAVKKDTTHH